MIGWIVLTFALEVGLRPQGDVLISLPSRQVIPTRGVYYTEFETEVELSGFFFIGGSIVTTSQMKENPVDYRPYNVGWMVEAGVRPWDFLEIGWRHWCEHPVIPFVDWDDAYQAPAWEQWYEEIYARVEIEVAP